MVRPVLFVIYINDIPDKLSPESYIFADDTNIFRQTEATQYKEQLCNMTIAVTINSKLYFEQHMNKKTNKANIIMGLIRRILTFLDEEILLLLYKALVRLEYVNTIWNPYKIKDIRAIQNVQRRATKAISPLRNM